MARRMSTTPRGQSPVEHGSIMDLYPQANEPEAREKAPSNEPSLADVLARLGEVNARLDAQDRERDTSDFRQAPGPDVKAIAAQAPTLDLNGLPDPVTDSQGYAKAIAERTLKYQGDMNAYAQKQAQAQRQGGGDLDALWEDFQDAYPEYVEGGSDRLKFATQQVAERLRKRGVDVNKFMFGRSDRFFQMMTEEYDATFGEPQEELYDDEQQELAPPRQQRRAAPRDDLDDGDDGRSEGILGGGDIPGGRRNGPARPQGGLIEDLQAIQRKTGYY